MRFNVFFMIPTFIIFIAMLGLGIYVTILIVKALRSVSAEGLLKETQ